MKPANGIKRKHRYAAIDIGSHALRFLAVEFKKSGKRKVLDQSRVAVRLGHGAFQTGRLTEEAMNSAVMALQDFSDRMAALHVRGYRAVATSAVRESANGMEFVARVLDVAGISIDVISSEEEARLVHVAVRRTMTLKDGHWLLVDLGGGSLEVSVVDENGIAATESYGLGAVRLLEEESGEQIRAQVDSLDQSQLLCKPVRGFIATGGNIEVLAQLAGSKATPGKIARLPLGRLREIISRLGRLSYNERMAQVGLRTDRADVIMPAAIVYERAATIAGVEAILVPGVGVKEGIVIDLFDNADLRDG